MRLKSIALVALAASASASVAQAQGDAKVTVSSLLAQDFSVVAATAPASGGAGLFLKKARKLSICLVSETPNSASAKTDYCKPVE